LLWAVPIFYSLILEGELLAKTPAS